MLINELPNDCLIAIFEYVNDLDDIINCYKVCLRWSYLIAERTKKAKYLMEDPAQSIDYELLSEDDPDTYITEITYLFDCVYYKGRDRTDVTYLNTLFRKLKIFEYTHRFLSKVKMDIFSFVSNQVSLKGIIDVDGDLVDYFDKVEMLSCASFEPTMIPNGSNLKQLYTEDDSLEDVKRYAQYFPNLEILHVHTTCGIKGNYDSFVPVFEKLKILVLYSIGVESIFYGFQFIDSCPNLQSAHITLESNHFFVDETLKHKCLQDLVIHFNEDKRTNWNDKKRLLMKYPNLKHLALTGVTNIKKEHIKELVHILPNLVLLIIENSPQMTRGAVDIVKDYFKRNGRSIKFYEDKLCYELESDWPQLSTTYEKISRGFDFMKHYFLKDNIALPHFLIPIDH